MRTLYLFAEPWSHSDLVAYAMSDNGIVLATHICSHISYLYNDLYGRRVERKPMWEEHFGGPEGEAFQVVTLPMDTLPPADVLEKNRLLGDEDTSI